MNFRQLLFTAAACAAFCGAPRFAPTAFAAGSGATQPSSSETTSPGSRLDPAAATRRANSALLWYDAHQLPLEGRGFDDTPTSFSRLPARAEKVVPGAVWNLSKNTTGLIVRFATDSPTIGAAWNGGKGMKHMAPTGSNGLDLYARENGKWVFCGVGQPETSPTVAFLAKDRPKQMTEYMLYLPLYAPVTDLQIGLEENCVLQAGSSRPAGERPVVFYGTSITQGGCASRAGMGHTGILGRWLDREVINLGFSGSGKMEHGVTDFVNELDASVFVLESLPNMTVEQVSERFGPCVKKLRASHPDTPILLVENLLYKKDHPQNRALQAVFQSLKDEGVKNIHYLDGEPQLAGTENGTVDGVHPTDLGFLRMAEAYHPVLKRLLAGTEQ